MYLNSKNYEIKYRKYKEKYKELKDQFGGECTPLPNPEKEDLLTVQNLLDLCPEERITIQNKCYEVKSLYEWIIEYNNKILPVTQTVITPEEKQELIQAFKVLPNILTRNTLIKLYPDFQQRTVIELVSKNYTSIHLNVFNKLSHIKDIKLSNNQIRVLEPGTFIYVSRLKNLWLNNNQISVLPLDLLGTFSLEYLNLSYNKISILPPDIFNNVKMSLKFLDISNNQISVLPHGMFTKLNRLEELYLSNNQIQELQPNIFIKQYNLSGWSYLKILDLRNNQISVIQPKTFKHSINLEKLFLSNNPIVSTLKQHKGITGLGLINNVIIYV